MITKNTIVRKNESIVTAELDGNAVMMSIENGRYYSMNEVATAIWEKIENPLSVEQLVSTLTSEFAVSADQCETEVIALLSKLNNEKLIEVK